MSVNKYCERSESVETLTEMVILGRLKLFFSNQTVFDFVRMGFGLFGVLYFRTSSFEYLFGTDVLFQVPLFETPPFSDEIFMRVIAAVHVVSLLMFIVGFRVALSGLVAGVSKFAILLAHLNGVLAFSFFLPLGYLAFAATAMLDHPGRAEKKAASEPLLFFLASVFLTAGLQKIFRIDDMQMKLPWELGQYLRPDFVLSFCPSASCLQIEGVARASALGELSIGLLMLWGRTRRLAFFLNFVFCVFLFSAVALKFVGVVLLTIQLALVFHGKKLRLGEVMRSEKALRYFKWIAPMMATYAVLLIFSQPSFGVAREFVGSLLLYGPFFVLGDVVMAGLPSRPLVSCWPHRSAREISVEGLFCAVLLIFGLFPRADDFKKTQMMGWSMFSGANARNTIFQFSARKSMCPSAPNFAPLIWKRVGFESEEFESFSLDLLNRYRLAYQRVCADGKASEIILRPSLAERRVRARR